ncbi:MAG: hypothetical protein HYY16_10525 [Planctomycetes bacterium]|nr:hypothetical protein [Planctomycetota bacterium]
MTMTLKTAALALALAAAATAGAQDGLQAKRDETGLLPETWSIDDEVKGLETSVKDFTVLIKSLGSANTELQELLAKHLQNPSDALTGSLLEKKLAAYASDAVRDFDRIISNQDTTISSFRSLNRKLNRFNAYLQAKIESTKGNTALVAKEAQRMETQLSDLAASVKHASSPEEERQARQKFSRLYHRWRLQKRYADGYGKNHEGYQKLSDSLVQLNGLFGTLRDKFVTLIENLETERQFLLDNMNLQEDSMKVKVLIQDGVISGQEAIGRITEKMALLFLKVDAFNKINDRIFSDMDPFNDFQQQMLGITDKLQAIGAAGDPASLDDAIDQFYRKRFGDEDPAKETEVKHEKE